MPNPDVMVKVLDLDQVRILIPALSASILKNFVRIRNDLLRYCALLGIDFVSFLDSLQI